MLTNQYHRVLKSQRDLARLHASMFQRIRIKKVEGAESCVDLGKRTGLSLSKRVNKRVGEGDESNQQRSKQMQQLDWK